MGVLGVAGPGVAGGPIVVTGVMGVVGGVVSPATGIEKKRERVSVSIIYLKPTSNNFIPSWFA